MAAPLDINREEVKLLVMRIGCTEAAKQLGIPLNTVLSWSARGRWLKPAKPDLPPTVAPRAINAIKPSQALANALAARKTKIDDNLSRYLVNASTVARKSRAPLRDAQAIRHVAAIKQAVYPEEGGKGGLSLSIGIVNGGMQ